MRTLNFVLRAVFILLSAALMLLAAFLLAFATLQVVGIFEIPATERSTSLLNAVGLTIISLAVFEVGKFLLEEEVIDPTEMRHLGESRRGMTKFISTITIAVFLEALVLVFVTGKDDVENLLYPALLLFAGISMVVGLGIYQRMSATAERVEGGGEEPRQEKRDRRGVP